MMGPLKKTLLATAVSASAFLFAASNIHAADEFDVPSSADMTHDERAIQAINEVVTEAMAIVSNTVDLLLSADARNALLTDILANAEIRETLQTDIRNDTIIIRDEALAQTTLQGQTLDEDIKQTDLQEQILDEDLKQTDLLQQQVDASTGTKVVPDLNDLGWSDNRGGADGLREIGVHAQNNEGTGVNALDDAITNVRDTYYLNDTFLQISENTEDMRIMLGHHTSQGVAALATAEVSYKRANASMERLNGYATDVYNTADIKESIDLNTVILIEIAQQLNESLRTQSAIASMAGLEIMSKAAEINQNRAFFSTKGVNR